MNDESTRQKAEGWDAVVRAMRLNRIDWYLEGEGTGIERMVATINRLAKSAKEPTK